MYTHIYILYMLYYVYICIYIYILYYIYIVYIKASSKKNAIKLYNKRLEVSRSYNEDAVSMKIAL